MGIGGLQRAGEKRQLYLSSIHFALQPIFKNSRPAFPRDTPTSGFASSPLAPSVQSTSALSWAASPYPGLLLRIFRAFSTALSGSSSWNRGPAYFVRPSILFALYSARPPTLSARLFRLPPAGFLISRSALYIYIYVGRCYMLRGRRKSPSGYPLKDRRTGNSRGGFRVGWAAAGHTARRPSLYTGRPAVKGGLAGAIGMGDGAIDPARCPGLNCGFLDLALQFACPRHIPGTRVSQGPGCRVGELVIVFSFTSSGFRTPPSGGRPLYKQVIIFLFTLLFPSYFFYKKKSYRRYIRHHTIRGTHARGITHKVIRIQADPRLP